MTDTFAGCDWFAGKAHVGEYMPGNGLPVDEGHRANAARGAAPVADAHRPVTVWELLVWTYRDQRAGSLGIGRGIASKFRWAEYLSDLACDGRSSIHVDAGAVHRVVCGILDGATARLVIEHAQAGTEPEPCTAQPQPRPVPNEDRGRGGAAHTVRGEWVEVPEVLLTAAEHRKLQDAGDHGEIERSAVPGGAHRWRYRVDLRPRRRSRRERSYVDGKGRRLAMPRSGYGAGDQVWSTHCPIEYWPDPAYIAMTEAVHARFLRALERLEVALLEIPFRSRRLMAKQVQKANPFAQKQN